MDPDDIAHRFAYHPPIRRETLEAHVAAREMCRLLAERLNELLPDGREKSLAITHLEETLMWSNAAIARSAPDDAAAASRASCMECGVLMTYAHSLTCSKPGTVQYADTRPDVPDPR